jgi:enoyl-CoA hydratase
MNFENITFEIKYKTGIIKINRPDKLNALNCKTIEELKIIFGLIKIDDNISVIIITGAGEKAFVAGADISELNKLTIESAKEFSRHGQEVFNLIEYLGKPVIAAVNGFALGGGCELALACHIRLASVNAKFSQPEVNLGIIPGYGGTQRLARLINQGRAAELILTGDMIGAEEAYRLGLVNKIYPADELMHKALDLADKIVSKGSMAVRMALKAILAAGDSTRSEGLDLESSLFAICTGSEDFTEGTNAFLEKRKPNFKN